VRAFTLIELLVVVALIGILAGLIGFSLNGGGQEVALQNAQRSIMAMVQAAQDNAILEGVPARFIVYSDQNWVQPSSPTAAVVDPKCLRYYGVVYGYKTSAGTMPTNGSTTSGYGPEPLYWTAANQGAFLPDGVYFMPGASSSFAANMTTTANSALTSTNTFNIIYPVANSGAVGGGVTGDYYYYLEFTPTGLLESSTTTASANLIIGAANTTAAGGIDFGGVTNLLLSGVQIRYLGGVIPFTDAKDITGIGQN